MQPSIVVIGSINMDIVNRVHRQPKLGETVKGLTSEYHPGGKGANQAVAAARLGAQVTMIGAVGDDPYGTHLISSLQKDGIRTDKVKVCRGTSGMAFITVSDAGENSIILSAGSNDQVTPHQIAAARETIESADVILLQNEILWETTEYAIKKAYEWGIPVFLNPAPAVKLSPSLLSYIDLLVVNQTEAEVIAGLPVSNHKQAFAAANWMVKRGVKKIVITLGQRGAFYLDRNGKVIKTRALDVSVVDTTSAGDTFVGAYTVAHFSGMSEEEALRFASMAAALTVTKQGAQTAIPTRTEIECFQRNQPLATG